MAVILSDDTTVAQVDVSAYTFPTDAAEGDGTLSWDSTTMVMVSVHAGRCTGVGWTYGAAAVADLVRDTLAPLVTGSNAMDVPGTFETMVCAIRNIGRSGTGGQAISAVDAALWDLKARLMGLPLYRLLGAVRDSVAVYGSGGFTTYDDHRLNDQLTYWTAELAIPRVKIKIGESWGRRTDRDVARMRQAREVIGDSIELFVDANGAYGRKQAVRVWQAVADLDVRWYEEPVSSDDVDGLRAVRDSVGADVAAGEYGYDLYDFRRLCAARAVDCLQVDASRCGGITEWLRAAAVAAAHNLDISGHCAPYLHLHAAAATPNFRHLEWFHDHVRIEQMAFEGADQPIGGVLWLDPAVAGNGLAPRTTDLEKFRIR
ncbi:enolase C-terminal domain-like protein [Mycobacterium sp. WMMD1722]|uniref:enolase C-terminal domain-like protein n=1 Tax=Mycobacterium sp. WMMD1722 TaxID=3404117 RepID=UPI003BF54FDA